MSQIILHLGCHKTGSTWLQEFFFPKIRNLWFFYKWNLNEIPEDMGELPMLISDEELSKSMPDRENHLEQIYELKKKYPGAKIILGIRRFNPWFESCYRQTIKTGRHWSKDKYFTKYGDCPTPEYYAFVCQSLWKDVFVYSFENFCRDKDKVLVEMCKFMDVEKPAYEDIKINSSIKHVTFWRVINYLMCGEWLRHKIEAPYWILTYPFRKLGLIWEESSSPQKRWNK